MRQPLQGKVVQEAIGRYQNLGTLTIAKAILYTDGDLFDNNLEKIRSLIRYYRGASGASQRDRRKLTDNVTPRHIPQSWCIDREPYELSPGTWLCLFDLHVPFHEQKPIEATISYAKKMKIDGILYGGDLQDAAAVSYWPTSRKRDIDTECAKVVDFLDFMNYEFPKQKKVYKPGNHEYRLPRLFQSRNPELQGMPLAVTEEIFDYEGRGIEYLDYKQIVMAGKLPIMHGHEVRNLASTINPARGLFMKIKSWGMCGHCHRTSEHTEKNIKGSILTTWSVGCLCDLQPEYDPYSNNWNWGFSIINIEKDGNFEVENRRILPNGKVV